MFDNAVFQLSVVQQRCFRSVKYTAINIRMQTTGTAVYASAVLKRLFSEVAQ